MVSKPPANTVGKKLHSSAFREALANSQKRSPIRSRSRSDGSIKAGSERFQFQVTRQPRSQPPRHQPYSLVRRLRSNPFLYALADIGRPDVTSCFPGSSTKPMDALNRLPSASAIRGSIADASSSILRLAGPHPEPHYSDFQFNSCESLSNAFREGMGQVPLLTFSDVKPQAQYLAVFPQITPLANRSRIARSSSEVVNCENTLNGSPDASDANSAHFL